MQFPLAYWRSWWPPSLLLVSWIFFPYALASHPWIWSFHSYYCERERDANKFDDPGLENIAPSQRYMLTQLVLLAADDFKLLLSVKRACVHHVQ